MRKTLTLALICLAVGCNAELETGYKPKSLGVSEEQRRSYYAPAFSPEAQPGPMDAEAPRTIRRPEGY